MVSLLCLLCLLTSHEDLQLQILDFKIESWKDFVAAPIKISTNQPTNQPITSLGIIKESAVPSVSVTTSCTVCGIPGNTSNHYCRFEITRGEGWTLEGDDTIICGTPFCIKCVEDYSYSGMDECRICCPSHHRDALPPNAFSDVE